MNNHGLRTSSNQIVHSFVTIYIYGNLYYHYYYYYYYYYYYSSSSSSSSCSSYYYYYSILIFHEPTCIQSKVIYPCASWRARVGVQRGLWNLLSLNPFTADRKIDLRAACLPLTLALVFR